MKNLRPVIRRRLAGAYRMCCWIAVFVLVPLNCWAFVTYRQESDEVTRIADEQTSGCRAPSDEFRALVRFVAFDVPQTKNADYFLLPIFSPLRPTPLQCIQHGGDCAYKARALMALLARRGIASRKLSLHTPTGFGSHAAVLVTTERGDYVADALFGIVYDTDDGSPIALEELRTNAEILPAIVARELARGNTKPRRYPFHKYVYTDVRTYDLEQYRWTSLVRRGLVALAGKTAVDQFPRPQFIEEPALDVICASAGLAGILWLPVCAGRLNEWRRARRAAHRTAQGGLAPAASRCLSSGPSLEGPG